MGTSPLPCVRPNQKLKHPCGVFIFGLGFYGGRTTWFDYELVFAALMRQTPNECPAGKAKGIKCAPTTFTKEPPGWAVFIWIDVCRSVFADLHDSTLYHSKPFCRACPRWQYHHRFEWLYNTFCRNWQFQYHHIVIVTNTYINPRHGIRQRYGTPNTMFNHPHLIIFAHNGKSGNILCEICS